VSGRRHLILLALLVIVGSLAASLPEGPVSGSSRRPLPEPMATVPIPPDSRPALGGTGGAWVPGFVGAEPPPAISAARLNDEGMSLTRLGWHRVEAGDYAEAVRVFEEADRAQPGEGSVLLGIGVAHYLRGDGRRAEAVLYRALDADANQVIAHKLLGEIAYRADELAAASAHFETVLRLNPSDEVVRERLDRARNEAHAQAGFKTLEGRHFTVKFGGREDPAFARDVLGRLEAAYQDVGRRLGHFPDGKVPVILYADQEFRDSTVTPAWAQGVFDGKIRLPVGGLSVQAETLNTAIRHEYTHALLHAWTRGNVPTWLTEGLARTFEGSDVRQEWDLLRKAEHLVPLHELHGSFLTLPPSQRGLAYAESFAAVHYLLNHHGVRPVRTLLKELAGSKDFDRTFLDAVGLPYADFQAGFIRNIIVPNWRRS